MQQEAYKLRHSAKCSSVVAWHFIIAFIPTTAPFRLQDSAEIKLPAS